ncbi:MAG: UDP-N-acetylmuramoyl-L-alanine--D-glutamate ligase [Psychromonas sp.]|nr:UDP-N-acetylmuramoyl-L-alanine--D-glutamate ligase [Psychromonas sp.]
MQKGQVAVIGLGLTGLSVVQHMLAQGYQVSVFDTREHPPSEDKLPVEAQLFTSPIEGSKLIQFSLIILSPGIALSTPALQIALKAGCEIIGDIELFARQLKMPSFAHAKCVTITGTNGKSTVTTMLGDMASAANIKVAVGGNIGVPALNLLAPEIDLYILELSSFQLETTTSLNADIATILNISEDHLDRYDSYLHYINIKHRIYSQCKTVLYNSDDLRTFPKNSVNKISFGYSNAQYALISCNDEMFLAREGVPLLSVNKIKLSGRHNWVNALAAIALGDEVGIDETAMLWGLQNYKGLSHRCEFIADINGVRWINDSKSTNVGSTCSALFGLSDTIKGRVHVILGGQGKNAKFQKLNCVLDEISGEILCIGEDATEIAAVVSRAKIIANLSLATQQIYSKAKAGDLAILSPACASFDMFDNYIARGDKFKQLVLALQSGIER